MREGLAPADATCTEDGGALRRPSAETAAEMRKAKAADLPAIHVIVQKAYSRYIPRLGRPPGPMLDDYDQLIRDGHVWVAERSGTVVGVLVLIPQADHLLLHNVAVHPDTQGQGVGRLMLDDAERLARQGGYSMIRLYTNEVMTENVGLYSHLGYVETHRAQENGFRRIYMAKVLD